MDYAARYLDQRAMDDRRALEMASVLVRLRSKAARRVPEWSPEMREELRRVYRKHRSFCPY